MTITQKHTDNFIITDIIFGKFCQKEYLYYSKEEATELFKKDFKELYNLQKEEALDAFKNSEVEIIAIEPLTPNEDIVATIDYSNGKSVDIVSIDKHLFLKDSIESGFEAYLFNRDGTGDYEPIGLTFDNMSEVEGFVSKKPEWDEL